MSDEDDFEDEPDDNPFSNCALHRDGGVYFCGLVGSEECEFDCPFNIQIGRRRWYTPRRLREELIDNGSDGG